MIENAKQSKLLALFNKLDEHDKDTVIQLSESLAAKHENNTTYKESLIKLRKKNVKGKPLEDNR
jgi:hypothetical protein